MIKASKKFKEGEEVARFPFRTFRPRSMSTLVEAKCFFHKGKLFLPEGEGQLYEESEDPNLSFEIVPEKLKLGKENKMEYSPMKRGII